MRFEPGDVVLVRFPFTSLGTTKKRPALIVSPREFSTRYGDVVVLALTSRDQGNDALLLTGWKEAGLLKQTWVKPIVGTIAGDLVERKLGILGEEDHDRASIAIRMLIAEPFGPRPDPQGKKESLR
ncbi:MAG: type II toxin-antitoxin system PemK/MazF family toxin [Polyangia bacterium]